MILRKLAHSAAHLSALSIALGLAITLGLVTVSSKEMIENEQDIYDIQVSKITDVILRRLTVVEEILHSMRVLFSASISVDPDEFRVIAEDSLSRHTFIKSAMYLPLITNDERDSYVEARRDEGYTNFTITELKNDHYVEAQRRERYFPVIYQEPFDPATVGALGLDFLSLPQYESYILQAIDSADSSATMPEQDNNDKTGYKVFKAVYAGKVDSDEIRDRQAIVNGIVALHIDAGQLFTGYTVGDRMDISLNMHSAIDANHIVPLLQLVENEKDVETSRWRFYSFDSEHDIAVGSQHFQLKLHRGLHWEDADYWSVLVALLIGLMVTALLWSLARAVKAMAVDLQQRNKDIQQLVKTRTLELAQEKERAQITLKSIGDAVITTDNKANIEYMNAVAEQLTGWTTQAVQGKPIVEVLKIVDEMTDKEMPNLVQVCLKHDKAVKRQENSVLINNNGDAFAIDESAALIHDKTGNVAGVVLVFHDVSQTRKLTQKMLYQATHDALTGLPNRMLLMDRLQQEFSRAPRSGKVVVVMFLDLDRFKVINDNLGHDTGDQLIQQVAKRLGNCLREGDTVSRLGGDEFVIILTGVAHHDDIRLIADKVLDSFKAPFYLKHQEIFTSASIGISIYPEGGANPKEMMKNADAAMYMAKARGKNNFVFYSTDINLKGRKNLSLEADLRRAIERKELLLFYQPQVDAITGTVIGAEALLRWKHHGLGMMPPIEFVPLAEESDLIVDIGCWVLMEACRQNMAWQHMGLPKITIAVNISDRQFQSKSLQEDVSHALKTTGLAAKYLELELTEGILAKDAETASCRLDQLKQAGIKLSIDDFGTGYSSLAYLKRFPLDTVKVDRAFVMDIATDPSDAAICAAIIAMAHNLNLSVIAEGVETDKQLAFLRQKGCDSIQGYYFSSPVPGDEFAGVMKRLSTEKYNAAS